MNILYGQFQHLTVYDIVYHNHAASNLYTVLGIGLLLHVLRHIDLHMCTPRYLKTVSLSHRIIVTIVTEVSNS